MVSSGASRQADESWVWPLRAERQKEPRLNPVVPKRRKATSEALNTAKVQEETQTLNEAIRALEEVLEPPEAAPQPQQRQLAKPSQSFEERRSQASPAAPDFGETLLFWKEYDSKPYLDKGLPAWREDSQTPRPAATPLASPRSVLASPRCRDWGAEAMVQRRLLTQQHSDLPECSMAMDMEVQLRSKERLRQMIRTGQHARVKQELEASLPPVPMHVEERRPSMKLDTSILEDSQIQPRRHRAKAAAERKKREGAAAEALRIMTQQRNELAKARRALEQVVDRRRESDKKLEKLQKVLAKYAPKIPKQPAVPIAVAAAIHEQFQHMPRERSGIDKA